MFNGKKGQIEHEVYYIMAQLFLVALVAVSLFSFVNSAAKGTLFERSYFTRDIALTMDSLYASPGEVIYNYPEDLSNYYLRFGDGTISMVEFTQTGDVISKGAAGLTTRLEGNFIGYTFFPDIETTTGNFPNPESLQFNKKRDKLDIIKNE